jgi:N6-adenosine-specific RNA methylase IME4
MIPFPDKKYNIIYADPPWSYKAWNKKEGGRTAESHYQTMKIDEIKRLPVGGLAADDCVLFMWATYPCLNEALETIKAWGFKYKTVAEICIIATKGKPKRISKSVHSIIDAPVEEHSKKPDITRDRIVQLMGDLPRIELFARAETPGWDVWGNEVNINLKEG